jgi:hypothetical protein
MVGPNGLEPSTSSVSRKRSNQTELRAYMRTVLILILRAAGNSGNVWLSAPSMRNHGLITRWKFLCDLSSCMATIVDPSGLGLLVSTVSR